MKQITKEDLLEALDRLDDGEIIYTEHHLHDYVGTVFAKPALRLETVTCVKRPAGPKILDPEKIEKYEADEDEELVQVTVLV